MNICCKAVWAKTHALQFLIPPRQMNIGWKVGMEEQSNECVLERGVSEGYGRLENMCLLSGVDKVVCSSLELAAS